MKLDYSYIGSLCAFRKLNKRIQHTYKIYLTAVSNTARNFLLHCKNGVAVCHSGTLKAIGMLLPLAFFCFMQGAKGQERAEIKPLVIGQKVPDEFWTKEHLFYVDGDTVRKTLAEYKGKLLVLDFWATWCGPCLIGFKKVEDLSDIYRGRCGFLLVNSLSTKDNLKKISDVFSNSKGKFWNNELPTVIFDEYLDALFPHIGVPYVVWINSKGTVYALTRSPFLEADMVFNLITRYDAR